MNFTNEANCFVDLEDPHAIRTELRAQYRCEPGEKPERLRVDAVINGIGKAWIDDIRLTAEPLK